jgi:hypothetical protein
MPATGMSGADVQTTQYTRSDGTTVVVNSAPGQVPPAGPAPPFAQLDSNGNGSVDTTEAAAYPLLANDFKFADGNDNGSVSSSEYTRWSSKP